MVLFFVLSIWCAFVASGLVKLWLNCIQTGVYRGQRGYRIKRDEQPYLFWTAMVMMGLLILLSYGIAAVFLREALF